VNQLLDIDVERVAQRFEPNPHAGDPVGWVRDRTGGFLWSKQRDIMESVRDHRYTAVRSCHGTGKSFTGSRAAAWWLDVHPPGSAFVVTTAPTQPQVHAILWREIGKVHRAAALPGRVTLDDQWYIGQELVAFGRKPADYVDVEQARQAFQGIHARFVLFILDEACGIPQWLWEAAESQVTNDESRILAIGNPDDPATEFEKVHRPESGWNSLHISAFDLPAYTGEPVPESLARQLTGKQWVEERAQRWGVDSAIYQSKVLGEFPEIADDVLISPKLIRIACERELPGIEVGKGALDVARYGNDETVAYRNRGGHLRRVFSFRKQDTHKTQLRVRRWMDRLKGEIPVWIDTIGIGAGVYDPLAADGYPVHEFIGSQKAYDPARFLNRRAEQYWMLRELMEDALIDIDPEDLDLHAQLGNIRWWSRPDGRTQIESKDDIIKRAKVSPDRADTVMMATCEGVASLHGIAEMHAGARPEDHQLIDGPIDPDELDEVLRATSVEPATVTGDLLEKEL
jgi:hypothetical protein